MSDTFRRAKRSLKAAPGACFMTEQRVRIRVKKELSEVEDHARTDNLLVLEMKREGPAGVYIPRPQDLVPIPPGQYRGRFPHGCPVLYTDTREAAPLVVFRGEVECVWIDVSIEGSRDFFYSVTRSREPSITAAEHQLQWAPGCRVLVKLPSVPGQKWTRAVIRGSFQEKADASPLYSVQLVEPATALFHGILKDCINYRFESSDPRATHSKTADACSDSGEHLSPKKEETDEYRLHSPEPPSLVDASPAAEEASKECVQPAPPSEVPATANEVIQSSILGSLISQQMQFSLLNEPVTEPSFAAASSMGRSVTATDKSATSCVQPSPTSQVPLAANDAVSSAASDASISARKRSLPVDKPLTDSSIAEDPFMGRAVAELEIPAWMGETGLNDSFVELICFADRNLNEYSFRVLESSPKNLSDLNVSLSPKQTIFLHGRDLDAVGEACDLVTDLLYRYVGVEDKRKLRRSLQYDGWRKSLIGNDAMGNTKHTSSNKKAKVTLKAESKTFSGTAVSSIPQMLIQNSSSDIANESRVRNEAHPAPPYGSSQPPTSQDEALYEYSNEKHENRRFDRDDTIRILIPKFADPVSIMKRLIGETGRNHKSLVRETGCEIQVNGLNDDNRGRNRCPIEVEVTGHDLERAREIVEDEILSTVRREDKGKMLYYLSKINRYGGSSEGVARFQRSPEDLNRQIWMAVVSVPTNFHKYGGVLTSKNGSGITQIKEDTKCRFIHVVNSQPTYIFLADSKMEAVNEAADAVKRLLDQMARVYKRNGRAVKRYTMKA